MNGENYTRKCFINTAILRILLLGRLYLKRAEMGNTYTNVGDVIKYMEF